MTQEQRTVSGTLFRGADGELYFVPDNALEPFRVFDSVRPMLEELLTSEELEVGETQAGESEVRIVAEPQRGDSLQAVYATLPFPKHDQTTPITALIAYVGHLRDME